MSLIKLAIQNTPIILINNPVDSSQGSSKTFSPKNVGAAIVGGTTGFGASELVQKIPGFKSDTLLGRYGKRMASVLGGFAGAATLYSLVNKKNKEHKPQFHML